MNPYEEGRQHYFGDGDKYSNPYPAGSYEHNEFERGWVQAQKRGNVDIGEQLFLRLGRKKKPRRHKSATTKEQYLRRKG